MYIIRGLRNLPDSFRGGVVAVGSFDGVHLGHQALFTTVRAAAREMGGPTLAMTFEPHPRRLLRPDDAPARITCVRGKARWMEHHGVDGLFIVRFTRELSRMTAEAFVRRYLSSSEGGLAAKAVVVGWDFRFGAGGKGDPELLERLGREHGFRVVVEPAARMGEAGRVISSTWVREAVQTRDFALAERLMGHPFELEGRVIPGRQRGRSLGFPTANLDLGERLHPPPGVYAVLGRVGEDPLGDEEGEWLPGVANLGINPTFGHEGLHLEVHFLAPCETIYRRVLRLRFIAFLREEQRFPDPGALVRQITLDVQIAREILSLERALGSASLGSLDVNSLR
ncbi:MAG: riboflavin biosynthesis protein RibF [Magnetococcales bacterium]|nr:riboflavin biosynthesis protein RibF [Magnetococcales bacterium]